MSQAQQAVAVALAFMLRLPIATTDIIIDVKLEVLMVTLTVRRIGSSLGVILPREAAQTLNVGEGDRLILTETPEGMKLTAYDADFELQIRAAEKCIHRYRNALRELAK